MQVGPIPLFLLFVTLSCDASPITSSTTLSPSTTSHGSALEIESAPSEELPTKSDPTVKTHLMTGARVEPPNSPVVEETEVGDDVSSEEMNSNEKGSSIHPPLNVNDMQQSSTLSSDLGKMQETNSGTVATNMDGQRIPPIGIETRNGFNPGRPAQEEAPLEYDPIEAIYHK